MVDQIEMTLELEESEDTNSINKELLSEIKDLNSYKACYERWEIASQMRSWFSEKAKDISLSLAEKAKENSLKNLSKISQEEAKEFNNDEEKIDITHPEMREIEDSKIREQEKLARQSLIDKVVKKAELLTKLSIPSSWAISDTSSASIKSSVDNDELNSSSKRDGEVLLYPYDAEFERNQESITDQLRRFKALRESRGSVKNYGKLSTDEIFKSCSTSVLACLQ